jgi:hypothetical protein
MKSNTTPRTLAECAWVCGHPSIPRRRPAVGWPAWALAIAIGVALAWAMIYGWSA